MLELDPRLKVDPQEMQPRRDEVLKKVPLRSAVWLERDANLEAEEVRAELDELPQLLPDVMDRQRSESWSDGREEVEEVARPSDDVREAELA